MAILFLRIVSLFFIFRYSLLGAEAAPALGSQTWTERSQNYGSYIYGFDGVRLSKRQASTTSSFSNSSNYVITGAMGGTGPDGGVPQRLEIRELQKNEDLWTLYILGLDMMQWTDQTDKLSWYQIAGMCCTSTMKDASRS
jgi:hypothetical protein